MEEPGLNEKLKAIIIEVTHSSDDVEDIEDADFLIDDLAVDSLGMMTLVEELEKRFGIKVPADEVVLGNFKTVELLAKYVCSKIEVAAE